MKIEIELPEIEGFEVADGNQPRIPCVGDYSISMNDGIPVLIKEGETYSHKYIILKKKAPVYKVHGVKPNGYPEFVEIKALEDAMLIVNILSIRTGDNTCTNPCYDELMELLK